MKIFNPEDYTKVKEVVVIGSYDEWKIIVDLVHKESENNPKKKQLKKISDDLGMVACY